MKQLFFYSIVLLFLTKPPTNANAQGTLDFANIGDGVGAPISGRDGLLSGDHTAWLATEKGVRIAGPTPFLANGLFSGGTVTVPGIPPGETIEAVLLVSDSSGEVVGTSQTFKIVLGGVGVPPSLPGRLTGLRPFQVGESDYYWWHEGDFKICAVNTPILMLVRVDDRFCEAEEERQNKVLQSSVNLEYSLQTDGQLRIRWLAGSPALLFGSDSLNRSKGVQIAGDTYQDGYRVLTVKPSGPKKFYWLAEPEQQGESN